MMIWQYELPGSRHVTNLMLTLPPMADAPRIRQKVQN
jgi:hypothetical protein